MIRNERQYRITKTQTERFKEALIDAQKEKEGLHPKLRLAQERAIQSQLEELNKQLEEYEELKVGGRSTLELSSFDEMPLALIQSRIASGLTQKDLAEKLLGLKEQQVQRYESTDYASASLTTISNVIKALDISVHQKIQLNKPISNA